MLLRFFFGPDHLPPFRRMNIASWTSLKWDEKYFQRFKACTLITELHPHRAASVKIVTPTGWACSPMCSYHLP